MKLIPTLLAPLLAPLLAMTAFAAPVASQAARAPVVVELFTSQGCSSCPPADAVLTDLATHRPDVLALAFHVTYWDYLGWKDPYGLTAATARQKSYAKALSAEGVYTPQMVVDGQRQFVGSDRGAALAAIQAAPPKPISLQIARDSSGLSISIGAGSGPAHVLLVGYDPAHQTSVGRGENGGRTLLESNIVRSLTTVGDWSGSPLALKTPMPAGERVAVILQEDSGRIVGAVRLDE
jgi:hypothetical protein